MPIKPLHSNKLLEPRRAEEALQPYLDLANLLHQSRELPSDLARGEEGRTLLNELTTETPKRFPVPEAVKRRRPGAVGWLHDDSAPDGGWPLIEAFLYEDFYAIRYTLRRIAFALEASLALPLPGPARITIPAPSERRLEIDRDGKADLARELYDGFVETLQRVDVRRVRACPVCLNLYYAWRKDKGGCSERCCNVINVRNARSREKKEQYKISRALKPEGSQRPRTTKERNGRSTNNGKSL